MGCSYRHSSEIDSDNIKLLLIQPEHFHAALVQKYKNVDVNSEVHLFADNPSSTQAYEKFIQQYNSRVNEPTNWEIISYYGTDFLEKAFDNDVGNVVILAGDNKRKIDFISQSIRHGKDVFADKPLVIDADGYNKLVSLLNMGTSPAPLLYDIMTERYDIKNRIVKSLLNDIDFSGGMNKYANRPAIQFNSKHHFIKEVSAKPLIRPAMFYNTLQQGEGLVDVTTHYIDLVYWILSDEQTIDLENDVKLDSSFRWPTRLSRNNFEKSTGLKQYPTFLRQFQTEKGDLDVYSNGKLVFNFRGIPISISVQWDVESPDKSGDMFFARFEAKNFRIVIKPDDAGVTSVFVIPNQNQVDEQFISQLKQVLSSLKDLPGLTISKENDAYKIVVPKALYLTHEDHFTKVLEQFVTYRKTNTLPEWEKSFMLAKYYLTTHALTRAKTIKYEEN